MGPADRSRVGISESLAREVEEHNIQVLIVEPGAFRTNFVGGLKTPAASSLEHYAAAKSTVDKIGGMGGEQPGDAAKAAARIVEAVAGTGMAGNLRKQILRLPLGPDCVQRYEAKVRRLNDDLEAVGEVAMSTNIEH